MKIEHIAMYVKDLEKTKTFFETYSFFALVITIRKQTFALTSFPLTMGQDWKL